MELSSLLVTNPGVKLAAVTDLELYDYSVDPDETVNQAGNIKYADVVTRLKAVLNDQFSGGH